MHGKALFVNHCMQEVREEHIEEQEVIKQDEQSTQMDREGKRGHCIQCTAYKLSSTILSSHNLSYNYIDLHKIFQFSSFIVSYY